MASPREADGVRRSRRSRVPREDVSSSGFFQRAMFRAAFPDTMEDTVHVAPYPGLDWYTEEGGGQHEG